MMVSQTAEYALRAVVWLGGRPNEQVGTKKISEAAQVPAGYLAKVLQMLARAGLVVSTAGRGGGFKLNRPPDKISVLDVINAVDPIQRIHECPLQLMSHGMNLCPLHRRLDDAMAQMEAAFARSTVAEMLAEETGSPPLQELSQGKPWE